MWLLRDSFPLRSKEPQSLAFDSIIHNGKMIKFIKRLFRPAIDEEAFRKAYTDRENKIDNEIKNSTFDKKWKCYNCNNEYDIIFEQGNISGESFNAMTRTCNKCHTVSHCDGIGNIPSWGKIKNNKMQIW